MEDEIQAQACKFPRLGNGRNNSNNKIGSVRGSEQYPNEEEENGGELRRRNVGGGRGSDGNNTNNFQSNWQHSSRIIRVSRASGGKDRHSKVMTSKGLRDRRVRLSVTTAIQFYDLQDRLGYDQPSKAVEWLIKAASDAISELPSLNNTFPETPKQPSDEKRPSDQQLAFDEADGETNPQYQQSQNLSLSKSACSSNSETSKGSGLSLSRSEIRVKARERARERAAKEKEKENESSIAQQQHHHNVNNHHNHMSQTASFTELLTGGIGSTVTVPTTTSPNRNQWSSTVTPMDYFSSGLLVGPSSRTNNQSSSSSLPVSAFSVENHSDQLQLQQHFPLIMHENLIQPHVVTSTDHQPSGSSHDYNLNFTISSGLAGYNRGTLQSNSPSLLPHLQRFSPMDGSSTTTSNNLPFFIGAAAAAPPTMENHHHLHFSPVFDGRLQLCYGDGNRHSDQKGKGNKN